MLRLCTLLFVVCLLPWYAVVAQCLQGDCENGKGKQDLGYAIYTGAFKAGKAHGYGVLDYGGGQRYEGHFINGREEGEGLLFRSGLSTAVVYRNGIMQEKKVRIVMGAGDALLSDINCNGNCENGQGTMKFPSGNIYTGGFKDGRFHGRGKMHFASGNILDGQFENHLPVQGSFTYAADGTVFTGTFNADGTPATGSYRSPETGGLVQIAGGNITKVSNPRVDSIKATQPQFTNAACNLCNGKGFSITTSTKYEQLTPNVYQASSTGYASLVRAGQSLKTTHTSQSKCKACSGRGTVPKPVRNN